MRHSSDEPLPKRLVVALGLSLAALLACNREPTPAPPAPPAESSAPAKSGSESSSRGEIAGIRYIEHLTGGARPDDQLPMIVALHPMGGDPVDLWPMFRHYRRPARFILPYGHPNGGMYIWFDSVHEDIAASVITGETKRIAAAISALVAARPTSGKPIITGYSQGGIMTFALAVTHPDLFAAAFPISGRLPSSLYPSTASSSTSRQATLPPIVAFHGAADLAVPTQHARTSIAELRNAGYSAELHEYPGLEHDISAQEERDIVEQLARAVDALKNTAPAP